MLVSVLFCFTVAFFKIRINFCYQSLVILLGPITKPLVIIHIDEQKHDENTEFSIYKIERGRRLRAGYKILQCINNTGIA